MKYLCLVYTDENILNAQSKNESDDFIDEHLDLRTELQKSNHSIESEGLQTERGYSAGGEFSMKTDQQ